MEKLDEGLGTDDHERNGATEEPPVEEPPVTDQREAGGEVPDPIEEMETDDREHTGVPQGLPVEEHPVTDQRENGGEVENPIEEMETDNHEHTGVPQGPPVKEHPVTSAPSPPQPKRKAQRAATEEPEHAASASIDPDPKVRRKPVHSQQARPSTPPSPTPVRRSGRHAGGLQPKDLESAGTHGKGDDNRHDPPTQPGPPRRKEKPVKAAPEKSSSNGDEKSLKTFIGSLAPEKPSITNMLDDPATPVSCHFSRTS